MPLIFPLCVTRHQELFSSNEQSSLLPSQMIAFLAPMCLPPGNCHLCALLLTVVVLVPPMSSLDIAIHVPLACLDDCRPVPPHSKTIVRASLRPPSSPRHTFTAAPKLHISHPINHTGSFYYDPRLESPIPSCQGEKNSYVFHYYKLEFVGTHLYLVSFLILWYLINLKSNSNIDNCIWALIMLFHFELWSSLIVLFHVKSLVFFF